MELCRVEPVYTRQSRLILRATATAVVIAVTAVATTAVQPTHHMGLGLGMMLALEGARIVRRSSEMRRQCGHIDDAYEISEGTELC